MDNKKIYKKVYEGDSLPSNGTIIESNVEFIIAQGGMTKTQYDSLIVFPFDYSSDYQRFDLVPSNNTVIIRINMSGTYYKWWMEYTKTTD